MAQRLVLYLLSQSPLIILTSRCLSGGRGLSPLGGDITGSIKKELRLKEGSFPFFVIRTRDRRFSTITGPFFYPKTLVFSTSIKS